MTSDESGYWDGEADRDALLDQVERRGRRVRARRRGAAAAGGLAVAALALALTTPWDGGDPTATLRVASPSSLPSFPTPSSPVPSTSTGVPTTTTTTTTPAGVVQATTGPPRTTAVPTTVGDGPAQTTTTTTLDPTVAPGPDCGAGDFTALVKTDKPAYTSGQTVRFEGEFVKVAGPTCYWVSALGSASVTGPGGQSFGLFPSVIADAFAYTAAEAGADFHHGAEWDPLQCGAPPCPLPPAGIYTATISYAPFGEASATFEVVAG